MDDLSEISKALHAAIQSNENHSMSGILTGYLTSDQPGIKYAALDTFMEILTTSDGDEDESRCKLALTDTALEYLPLILPTLSTTSTPSQKILDLITKYSSPREVVLGLNEGLQNIEERSEGFVVSDDEDGEPLEDDNGVDWDVLGLSTSCILSAYASVIPRLSNARSTPTLLSIDDAITSVLPILSHHMNTTLSRSLLKSTCSFIEAAWKWTLTTQDAGGEQKAILTQLLFMATTLFGARVAANLTSRWFTSTFPRFSNVRPGQDDDKDWREGQLALLQAHTTAAILGLTRAVLLDKLIHPTSTSPRSALASLLLLSSSLSPSDSSTTSNSGEIAKPPRTLLSDSMPVLSAALGSSCMDAGATWAWYLIHLAPKGEVDVEYDNATLLLELLVPLTSLQPSPTTRLALFKLLGAVIHSTTPPLNQILLFQQLLEPSNPFENIRVRSISLLREQIALSVSQPSTGTSFLSPDLLGHLGPILLALPTSMMDMDLQSFMEGTDGDWLNDVANLLWVLYDLDKTNESGIRAREFVEKVKVEWLGPVKGILGKLRRELTVVEEGGQAAIGTGQVEFVLDRLEDGLDRLEGVMRG